MRYVGEGYVYDVMEMYGVDAPKGSARRIENFFGTAARGLQMNGLAARRAVIEQIGGFDESLSTHEDKLFSGLLAHGRPWLVTGDLVSDVRRVDAQSLTELSSRDMEKRLANMLAVNDRLLALEVSERDRRLAAWGPGISCLMRQAARLLEEAQPDRGAARLLSAARCHPSPLKGWLKILPPLALGRRGMRFLPVKRFDR